MIKINVKFKKDRHLTVGGIALTRSPLQTRNHAKKSKLKMWKKVKKKKKKKKKKKNNNNNLRILYELRSQGTYYKLGTTHHDAKKV